MHMADALVSPAVAGTMLAVSAGAIAYSSVKIKKEFDEKKIPLMGVLGAFVFAAQMINFTIPATGSSGHIGGGILLASLLGPYPAFLALTAVLLIQALFFADGGLLALGCNIFNMGILPCLVVFPLLYRPIVKQSMTLKRISIASILSVVVGLQLGSFGVVAETTLSGITQLPFSAFLFMMQPIHLAIGLVEGIVTAAVVGFLYRIRPEILQSAVEHTKIGTASIKKVLVILGICTVIVGGGLSLLASSFPDGLEWSIEKVAGTAQLESNEKAHASAEKIQQQTAFMPDYAFESDQDGSMASTSAAGIIGGAITCITAGAAGLIIHLVKKRNKKE
jgi:cobalt/nickel transport system permease protein